MKALSIKQPWAWLIVAHQPRNRYNTIGGVLCLNWVRFAKQRMLDIKAGLGICGMPVKCVGRLGGYSTISYLQGGINYAFSVPIRSEFHGGIKAQIGKVASTLIQGGIVTFFSAKMISISRWQPSRVMFLSIALSWQRFWGVVYSYGKSCIIRMGSREIIALKTLNLWWGVSIRLTIMRVTEMVSRRDS